MKKTMTILMAVMLISAVAFAGAQDKVANFDDYKVDRKAAWAAFNAEDFGLACDLFRKLAGTDHANRADLKYVKAWALCNAAYSLIKANEDGKGNVSEDIATLALALLQEARPLANKAGMIEIDKNITYCEGQLE